MKYHSALKADFKAILSVLVARVEGEDYDNITFDADKLNGMLAELKKVKGVIE